MARGTMGNPVNPVVVEDKYYVRLTPHQNYTLLKFEKGETKFDEDCRRKVGSEWANKH